MHQRAIVPSNIPGESYTSTVNIQLNNCRAKDVTCPEELELLTARQKLLFTETGSSEVLQNVAGVAFCVERFCWMMARKAFTVRVLRIRFLDPRGIRQQDITQLPRELSAQDRF